MTTEANKAAKLKYFEGFNNRDLSIFDELFDSDYVLHAAGMGDVCGPAALKEMVSATFSGLSNIELVAEDMLAEGDKVTTRWRLAARHTGNFMGRPATGIMLSVTGIIIDKFRNGKVVEAWEIFDAAGLMQQLETNLNNKR